MRFMHEGSRGMPVTATYFNAASSFLSALIWALSSLCVCAEGRDMSEGMNGAG